MRSLLTLVAVMLGLAAAPAGAATVRVDVVDPPDNPKAAGSDPPTATVIYEGAPGEANAVTVGTDATGAVVVADAGAALAAGPGCVAQLTGAVTCPVVRTGLPSFGGIDVRLGDGADRLTAATIVRGFGGAGADVLEGSGSLNGEAGDDTLTGGPGADTLAGGSGDDRVSGGAGDDVVEGDATVIYGGADVIGDDDIDGGEGTDTLRMYTRRGVLVDLAAKLARGSGQEDTVASVERVLTGEGGDAVLGSDAGEELSTGPGDDVVDGRGGDDEIDGGSGTDRLHGGDGDDLLRFTAHSCGTGDDLVDGEFLPPVRPDCERIALGEYVHAQRTPVRLRRGAVAFRLRCRAEAEAPCDVRLVLRTRGGTLLAASRKTRIRHGRSAIVRLRPTAAGRRLLDGRRLAVRVVERWLDDGWRATYRTGV